jgi:chromosome transmission fidelity protein 18
MGLSNGAVSILRPFISPFDTDTDPRLAYRPLDVLNTYETSSTAGTQRTSTRYAVRQVLDQEHAKHILQLRAEACQARYRAGAPALAASAGRGEEGDPDSLPTLPVSTPKKTRAISSRKRDFFGREIVSSSPIRPGAGVEGEDAQRKKGKKGKVEENKVWVSFHEGFSNAVRKPITLQEIMMGL